MEITLGQITVTLPVNHTLKPESKSEVKLNVTQGPKVSKRYTFATLLCDDKLLQVTSVLVYSMINYANTSYPVTIMALPNVTSAAKEQLRTLGAQILDITMLEYPYK